MTSHTKELSEDRNGASMTNAPSLLIVDDLIRARALDYEQKALLSFPNSEHSVIDYEHFCGKDLDRFVDHSAKYYIANGLEPNYVKNKCVAQLGPTDLAYVITFFALTRLGYTVLCLSPRLAPDACAKLISECGSVALIPGKAPQVDHLVTEVQKLTSTKIIKTVSKEFFDKPDAKEERFARESINREIERSWTCCILHSSGSTGLPKAFHIPHRRLMVPIQSSIRVEFNTFPMFHGYGSWIIVHNFMNKKSTYMYNPNVPLTADYVIKVVEHVRPQALHVVPYTVELLSLSNKGVDAMKSCQSVIFSGGGCSDELGDLLVDHGVNLENVWGATEMGFLGGSSNRPQGDKAWNYIRVPKPINDNVKFVYVEDNIYECVFLKSLPSLVASNSDNPPGSYWSKDLFQKHPTIPNAWKHVGRLDDRLSLANGEKVLPLPIEGRIRQNPLVKECVVFGTGRPIPGMLVFRNDESASLTDLQFINQIWPTVHAANARAEAFSQISKETIVPVDAKAEYPMTDKESIKRAQVYIKFSNEIEAMYYKITHQGKGTMQLDLPQIENWLLQTFKDQFDISLSSVNDDLFAAGVDSLQAIQMRGLMLKHIDLGGDARKLGPNIVFDKGTVARLARVIHSIQLREDTDDKKDEIQDMVSLIRKFSSFEKHMVGSKEINGRIVLLTGATGSLGVQILAQCLENPSIKHVYCLVRGSEPKDRIILAFQQRHLFKPSLAKFTALTADLSDPLLGLSGQCFATLQSSVTHVIHSAWAVNFNLGVRSFESQHLAGVHNLLQMTLSSPYSKPPSFYFCSSVAAALATPAPATIPETPIENLAHALPQGYARSKLVAEHIVHNASRNFGARARIFRIGQIVGDKRTGIWNDTEAVPLIIRSALTNKVLPELDSTESWLPVDTLASSICELAGLSGDSHLTAEKLETNRDLVYNLRNPLTFHWTKDLLPMLTRMGLQFETIPPSAWLETLRAYQGDLETNPVIKLLGYFESQYSGGGREQMPEDDKGTITFDMKTSLSDSEYLRSGPNIIQDGYIEKFVSAWTSKWNGPGKEDVIESSG